MAVEGLLQLPDVELGHRHHRPHDTLNARGVAALNDARDQARHDLPAHSELVGEPAALTGRAALAQPVPEFVDLGLRRAIDDQRDCRRELEVRAAVLPLARTGSSSARRQAQDLPRHNAWSRQFVPT
jgi:hypothetical protein